MSQSINTWDDVRRIRDEIGVKLHLASMEARDRWRALQPRIAKMEQQFAESSERAGLALSDELRSVGTALRELRDEIAARLH